MEVGLHRVGAVAVGADRRITFCGLQPGFGVHAAEIGRVDIGVAFLAGDLLDRGRRAFDDGVRVMAVGAQRSRRIVGEDQGGMDAGLPLIEFVGMTAAADLRHGDGKAARIRDDFVGWRMRGQIDVGMTAGAADRAVHGLAEHIGRYLQLQGMSVPQRLLHAGAAMARETLVGGRWRLVFGKRRRNCGGEKSNRCANDRDGKAVAHGRSRDFEQCAAIHNCPHTAVGFIHVPVGPYPPAAHIGAVLAPDRSALL